ncbi:scavenger receptor cysteine-rich domain-containing group B protein-like [Diadema antillarum]|uniref:scavenger receptor cysteine-rich domain-containing group B protein-like n=1 Tax=Diadema antillarum TaxID=105358 RepID=UPI003A87675E
MSGISSTVFLVDGPSPHEGRVEIDYGGYRGCVCDDQWDMKAASVVCRQLGFASAVRIGVGKTRRYPTAMCKRCRLTGVRCKGDEEALSLCSHRKSSETTCDTGSQSVVDVTCSAKGVRLIGGSIPQEGSVQVYSGDRWGTVCDDGWGLQEATVVCRQLGYTAATAAKSNAHFGENHDVDILLDDVTCSGEEADLYHCAHRRWGQHDCKHSEDAGVVCADDSTSVVGAVRLTGGYLPYVGRLEVYRYGEWGTVCNQSWHESNSQQVCNQLGYRYAGKGESNSWAVNITSDNNSPVYLSNVDCEEGISLAECHHDLWQDNDCTHAQDVFVTCDRQPGDEGEVRLLNSRTPNDGLVEVYRSGRWGSVLGDIWDIVDADVVCRQLGYRGALEAVVDQRLSLDSADATLVGSVDCDGSESQLLHCKHTTTPTWGGARAGQAGVVCADDQGAGVDGAIRLMGGRRPGEGRVEIYHSGVWGTICDDFWDEREAEVVCRQLGFRGTSEPKRGGYFGQGHSRIHLDDVMCDGTEDSLANCSHAPWDDHNCLHGEDAGVICQSLDRSIRLVNGSQPNEGRVEVYLGGSWGTVCDHHWDMTDAHVVCRFLGYRGASDAPGGAKFGRGSGSISMNRVLCEGSEISLFQCAHWPVEDDCSHDNDAAVVCLTNENSNPSVLAISGIVVGCSVAIGIVVRIFFESWRRRCQGDELRSPRLARNLPRGRGRSPATRTSVERGTNEEDNKYVAFYPFMPPPYSPTAEDQQPQQSEEDDSEEASPHNDSCYGSEVHCDDGSDSESIDQQADVESGDASEGNTDAMFRTSPSGAPLAQLPVYLTTSIAPPTYSDALKHQIIGPARYGGVPMVVYASLDECGGLSNGLSPSTLLRGDPV